MKITVEDFKKIVKSPHFLHLISINCLDVEYSVHECQNPRDDNLFKSDVQVGIYLKLLLIKLKLAVFLLIAKG